MILVIGKAFSKFYEYLSDRGDWGLIWDSRQKPKAPQAPFRIDIDFGNTDFNRLKKEVPSDVSGVVWMYENYVVPAALIAEAINVKSIPTSAAQACTDKILMRERFSRAERSISPDYRAVNSWEDCRKFADSHTFPLVLKPANLAKSLLITKNNTLKELKRNFKEMKAAIGEVYTQYAPDRTPAILIEEYMQGPVHSVEGFADPDGNITVMEEVVDYETGYEVGYEDNFHYSRLLPSRLPEETKQEMRQVASLGMKSLGLKSSPAHVELILTEGGPRIVEIGARNGGYRERMHSLANGIDLYATLIDNATGRSIDAAAKRHDNCAVIELLPRKKGQFAGLSYEEELRSLSSLNYLSIKASPGQVVGKASQGYKAAAVIILANGDTGRFNDDLAFVKQNVEVTVK